MVYKKWEATGAHSPARPRLSIGCKFRSEIVKKKNKKESELAGIEGARTTWFTMDVDGERSQELNFCLFRERGCQSHCIFCDHASGKENTTWCQILRLLWTNFNMSSFSHKRLDLPELNVACCSNAFKLMFAVFFCKRLTFNYDKNVIHKG